MMGKIVSKSRLFEDGNDMSSSREPARISNNYNAPFQIFNGPVFFGSSSDEKNNALKKRPRQDDTGNNIPKRRVLESKEQNFFNLL